MKRVCDKCKTEENKGYFFGLFGSLNYLHSCDWCGDDNSDKIFCGSCGCFNDDKSYSVVLLQDIDRKFNFKFLCPDCKYIFHTYKSRMDQAIKNWEIVERVSKNYRGKILTNSIRKNIESDFYEDRNDAIKEISIIAKYFNCDIIVDFEFIKDTEEEETESGGIYQYSVWKCKGIATTKTVN